MGLKEIFKTYRNPREKEVARMMSKSLKISFRKIDHYLIALRHKSAARNVYNRPGTSNERLEFLGDAILDAAVANYLFQKYPEAEEGELTKIKSRIVSRRNLNHMALEMGIDNLLETDLQAIHAKDTIAGNALEALVGAMYLDLGYPKTNTAILKLLERYSDLGRIEYQEADFKSRLFEEAHKLKTVLRFQTKSLGSNEGDRTFKAEVFLGNEKIGEGHGSSKKKAEQKAAEGGLQKLNLKEI